MIRNPGGLWDTSFALFGQMGATPKQTTLEWVFPSGASLKMAHLEDASTVLSYQGAQIPLIMFDELTHFEESQFWYLMSRLRSTSGVPGYVRATCNPDNNSFVRTLLDWWIGEDGLPIKERSGALRWFIKQGDRLVWANTRQELIDEFGVEEMPRSLTFIPSLVYDNKILLEKDPTYLANLRSLNRVDREQLLGGNWNVRPSAGMFFRREWFQVVDALPARAIRTVRGWDKAASQPTPENPDPDWTRGVKMSKLASGQFVIEHVASCRDTPLAVERLVKNTASQDGVTVEISIAQDPGSAGVADKDNFVRLLAGYIIHVTKPSTDKVTRAKPLSAQCEAGNILVLRGAWNEEFFKEAENFDGENGHDDQIDAASDSFNQLCASPSILDVLQCLRLSYF